MRNRMPYLIFALAFAAGCEEQPGMQQAGGQEIEVLAGTESSRDFGDFVVHFNAVKTDELTPEIAREYSIVRSQNRVLLNVSVLRKQAGAQSVPVPAVVAASAVNLTGQSRTLLVREIREGDAIYYIAETPITNAEVLIFSVDVTPENQTDRFSLRFQKQFFVD